MYLIVVAITKLYDLLKLIEMSQFKRVNLLYVNYTSIFLKKLKMQRTVRDNNGLITQ